MDKEKGSEGRELKKNGARISSFYSSSSPSPSGSNINRSGRSDAYAMESCRKERNKGLKGSCSDNKHDSRMDGRCNGGVSEVEEVGIFRAPVNANGGSSRKRVKLRGKVSDDHGSERPVDPPLVVPKAAKKLRSAINKRTSQSASPLSDSKKRHQHAYFGTQLFNRSNGENFQQKMLEEPTKDEEEVAATLISIASLITTSKPLETEEDGKALQANSETKATSVSLLKDPKEECTKFLAPCNGTAASNSIPYADGPDISTLEQPTDASVSQKFDVKGGSQQLEPSVALSSHVEPVEGITLSTDPRKLSSHLGTSHQYFPQNGMLQPKQSDTHLLWKQEIGPWPLGPTSMGPDVQSFNQKSECIVGDVGGKASSLQPGLLSKAHEQLAGPPSNKAVANPNDVAVSGRPGSANGLPNEKLSLSPADKEGRWNRCRTHVRICYLIRNHNRVEKKQLPMSEDYRSKAKEGTNQSVPTSCEINGSKSTLEVTNQMLHGARLLQAQQAAMLSGAYALQMQAVGDAKTSANEKKPGPFPAPYPPNQVYMPCKFSQGSYTRFQEQLSDGASQQVQLQLPPHYLATGQLYGPHVGHAAAAAEASTTTKQHRQQHQQHQLMWQAHYRPPMGFPSNWQQSNGGQPHNSSSSSSLLVNQPPSIFPLLADFNPQNLHQTFILPLPSPLSSLPMKSEQNSQSSAHLQMILNAESFR